MKTQIARSWLLAVILLGLMMVGVQTQTVQAKGVSPEGFLNADGTLKLDGSFSGSLNLSGWDVQIDSQRGPVFGPAQNVDASHAPTSVGQWSNLGSGLQALNNSVWAIAVSGADVYVGGNFTDANGMPAADYIVKWNGST